ncbi:MAG: HD domain-containing phosphohydrolase [Actinomycetota bacterium]
MISERVLCVDDDAATRKLLMRLVAAAGHDCVAANSVDDARQLLAEQAFSVVLCDIGLPGRSGLELLDELVRTRPDIATVMVTGEHDPSVANTALQLGAYGYITKPFGANELLIDLTNALHRRRLDAERREASESALQRAYAETLTRLSRAVEFHDTATGSHLDRVGFYAAAIAAALSLDAARVELLRLAAPLHDIGKVVIPDHILRKTGKLTPEERIAMQKHADVGRELLAGSGSELLELAAMLAWTHHERWDGSGYPRRLRGEAIPLEGRIVAVADVFDALTSLRPYRPQMSDAEALAYLQAERGKAFDPDVVDALEASRERAAA